MSHHVRTNSTVATVVIFFVILISNSRWAAAQTADYGVIEGVVVQTGSTIPVANAQVTLSGGAIKSESLDKMAEQLAESASIPYDDTMIAVRNAHGWN